MSGSRAKLRLAYAAVADDTIKPASGPSVDTRVPAFTVIAGAAAPSIAP